MHVLAPLAAALLWVPIMAEAAPDRAGLPETARVEQILIDRIERDRANIGIAIALIEDGVARFVSHGTLSRTDPTPVNEHTLFEAGSITKVMTNVLLAQLVLAGKIDLDAPLTRYLPAGTVLPAHNGRAITAFDLATHHAGFSGLPEPLLADELGNPYSGYDAEALLAWIAAYRPPRASGESFEYSNVGIALLAQAIEQVSGKDYAGLLEEQILAPLRMDDTRLALAPGPIENLAQGHDAAAEAVPHWDMDAFAPAGALVTSSADLAKFVAAASGAASTPLDPAFALMLDRLRPTGGGGEQIGLGWFVLNEGDRRIVWHNGITGGFRSFAGYDAKTGNGVVVLSNMNSMTGIEDIGLHLLDPAMPLREQPRQRQEIAIDPAKIPAYTGDYLLAPGVVITISATGDTLFAQITGQARYPIFAEAEDRFFFRIVDAQISFASLAAGTAPSLILHQNGRNLPALRLPAAR